MSRRPARLLVVEDDEAHAEALRLALEADGHVVETAVSAEAALDRLGARSFDILLTDLRLGGDRDGIDLLREVRKNDPDASVFLITGHGSVEIAVAAMREGAADYLTKPVNILELRARVRKEMETRRLNADNQEMRQELERRDRLEGMVGGSACMKRLFDLVRQVAPTEATVLILGESGTGKELVARALHRLSQRHRRRFVAVNCAALSETLIESELFGHVKGAFTGALQDHLGRFEFARGGTLFLDEIGDMPLATQAKLLRVLEDRTVVPVGANEERHVDVRILAATNRDLRERVADGSFREDLYYRLAVLRMEMPPLRERLEDLPLLAEHFRVELNRTHGKEVKSVREEVMKTLQGHDWPGNIRELRNLLETMVIQDLDGVLGCEDIPMDFKPDGFPPIANSGGYALAGKTLAEVEKDLIAATLADLGENRAKAAKILGIGERTLYRKIKEYSI